MNQAKCDNLECSKDLSYDDYQGRTVCFSVSWGDFCSEPCATRVRQEDYENKKVRKSKNSKDDGLHALPMHEVPAGEDGAQKRDVREMSDYTVQNLPSGARRRRRREK